MSMIASLLEARERAVAIHDWTLVTEIDFSLARNGYPTDVIETAVAPLERAVKPKRRK